MNAIASTSMDTLSRAALTFVRTPFQRRTWLELAHVTASFVLGLLVVLYLYFGVGGGLLVSVTVIGLPILALVVLGGRIWGFVFRELCRVLLRHPVDAPPEFRPRPGLIGFVVSGIADKAGWRAVGYLFLKALFGVGGGYVTLVFVAMTGFAAISPIPWALVPIENVDEHGVVHHSIVQWGDFYVETWPRVLLFAAGGLLLLLFVAPWPVRLLCVLDRWFVETLLGPTARDRRVAELESSRAVAVADSVATLRRVERDLHDGTQARLVTAAMALGRAQQKLPADSEARALVDEAHATTTEALRELRELVRGIHPPALELGLAAALQTLAARSAVPVDLHVDLPQRPSPSVEAIAYFSVAELLTNVAKHAGAGRARVRVLGADGTLVVMVSDDGVGGADPARGTGLRGLAARAATVDGTLDVHSPHGGPTEITLTLPVAG